jgi:hypothetical protein
MPETYFRRNSLAVIAIEQVPDDPDRRRLALRVTCVQY